MKAQQQNDASSKISFVFERLHLKPRSRCALGVCFLDTELDGALPLAPNLVIVRVFNAASASGALNITTIPLKPVEKM